MNKKYIEINPEEILLDSSNLPDYDTTQLEGRLEKPISKVSLYSLIGIFFIIMAVFVAQAWKLQVANGQSYRLRSEKNILRPVPLFAGRGVIYDRNGKLLVWNSPKATIATTSADARYSISVREYATTTGLAHVIGYVQYPSKDSNGFYYQEDFQGIDGVEKYYNQDLQGSNGSRLVEVDAQGKIISENTIRPPDQGGNITLSIDSRVQSALYANIKDIAERVGFTGGAGVIMDVTNGEIIALTSYPEYSPQVMSDRTDTAKVRALLNDSTLPFLDRAVDGLYTPGSIVKPYVAIGVLEEKIIDPSTIIVTNGSISIPNPYDDTKSTLFRDWKNHGPIDMRHAIAQSSDVYFYQVGGGYKGQKGLGILNIDKYLRIFSFGSSTLPSFVHGKAGTIPTPEWKKKTFDEDWYIGDTYHTAIGQYGFQVTPVQIVRAVAAIANNGVLLTPSIRKGEVLPVDHILNVAEKNFRIVQEGMRLSVTEGTSKALNVPFANIAGKSGTAELGVSKNKVNSWITGFWPYEKPKYAFVVIMESGSVHNLIGAAAAMRQQLDWMDANTPEYFQ
ncbi:MAG: penicillin-binding transpeptidase domain-containing protein [Candidatus Paceibacterota bacterium]